MTPHFGALILSLDFELHWGVRDVESVEGPYRCNLLGVRKAVPAILSLFKEFEISATWATVGLLFARSRDEALSFAPQLRPRYRDTALNPYVEVCGENENDDPFHYAPTLIERIQATPRQEIATHTFSHYYCLAEGQGRETFRADLASAIAIARQRDIRLTSIVFPRNEHNPEYDDILLEAGIHCYRGNQHSWMFGPARNGATRTAQRAARLAHDYFVGSHHASFSWKEIQTKNGLANVRGTGFLRPFSLRLRMLEPRRLRALSRTLERSAAERRLVHLWWHPHNFGVNLEENLNMLRHVLEVFSRLRASHGMRSLTIRDAAALAGVK
jgi:peptidoglycan/xylan/chitin deacetylase (PgdA/CDA1 family)